MMSKQRRNSIIGVLMLLVLCFLAVWQDGGRLPTADNIYVFEKGEVQWMI